MSNSYLISEDPMARTLRSLSSYAIWALILLVIFSICYIPFYKKFKKKGVSLPRQICLLGFGFSVFIVLYATLMYVPLDFTPEARYYNLIPFKALDGSTDFALFISEKIPNILVLIPLGFFLPLAKERFRSFKKMFLVALILPTCLELLQYLGGRIADIDDVIVNFVGCIIGTIVYIVFDKIFKNLNLWEKFKCKS